jgi:hypothetical protein
MNSNDRPTDPSPTYTLHDIGGMMENFREQLAQKTKDDDLIHQQIFTKLGEVTDSIRGLAEAYGRLVTRLDTLNYRLGKLTGEAADAISQTVPYKDYLQLKQRVEILEQRAGVGNDVDETEGFANREIGSGSR